MRGRTLAHLTLSLAASHLSKALHLGLWPFRKRASKYNVCTKGESKNTPELLTNSMYRDRLKSMHILLSRIQAGQGRAVKQEQEESSRNHEEVF